MRPDPGLEAKVRRCFNATHGARCLGLALVALPLSVHATEPAPPMVAASAVPTSPGATYQMFLDAQTRLEITGLAVSTDKKTVGGQDYQVVKKTSESGAQVTYRYDGKAETPLSGFEAVQWLVQLGYLRWVEGVGLVPTREFYNFGPGVTQAGAEGGGVSSAGSSGGASSASLASDGEGALGGGAPGTSDETWPGASAGAGGADASGSSPGSTTPRGGARSGGGAAEFNCEVKVEDSLLGGGSEETKRNCYAAVKAAEAACVDGCNGSSDCEARCREACDRTQREKCDSLVVFDVAPSSP